MQFSHSQIKLFHLKEKKPNRISKQPKPKQTGIFSIWIFFLYQIIWFGLSSKIINILKITMYLRDYKTVEKGI